MNPETVNKVREIAARHQCSHRIVNNHDGITIYLNKRRAHGMKEIDARSLQEELKESGFESKRKATSDGWTVMIFG